ncbi:MAG: GNAT family N-acetyltransferase [Erysipelotrichaceae bacterium]
MFELREATLDDAQTLATLIRELAVYEKLNDICRVDETKMRNAMASQTAYALLAKTDGVAIGYAVYYFTFSTFTGMPSLYLEDLYVKPEYRSQGIGTAFFNKIANIATQKDCQRIDFTCLKWNTNSLKYYQSLGAAVMDDWHLVRMEKNAIRNLNANVI